MPKDKTRVATINVSSYSATFNARGLTLAGELRSDGWSTCTAARANGTFAGVSEGLTTLDAINDLCGRVGIPGHPVFTS